LIFLYQVRYPRIGGTRFTMKEIETEEPELRISIPVSEKIVERLKRQKVEIKQTKSGKYFAYFTPEKWQYTDNTCTTTRVRVTIPYSLVDERVFININECIRLNKDGGLQELQTVCRDNGKEIAPIRFFKGNDQDRPRSIIFDFISIDFREKIIILKSELVNGQYVHTIVGLKAEKVENNQIVLTAQYLYESCIEEDENNRLKTTASAAGLIEIWYRSPINSHLEHLETNLKMFRRKVRISEKQVIRLGTVI